MQQVNLKRPMPPGPRLWTGHYLLLTLAATGVAVLLSLWFANRAAENERAVNAGRERVEQARSELESFVEANPRIGNQSALEDEIDRLNDELDQRSDVLQDLQSRSGIRTFSFYNFLRALATQRIDGAWLTRFRLHIEPASGTLQVRLDGRAEDPTLLPEYLGNLRDGGLRSIRFNNLQVDRAEQGNNALYEFRISTTDLASDVGADLRRSMPDEGSSNGSSLPPGLELPGGLPMELLQQSQGGNE